MVLTDEQRRWLQGDAGPALRWAMEFNLALGQFFGAERMVRVASVHFAPDARAGGEPGRRLVRSLAESGARLAVPGTLDPCMLDFGREAEVVSELGMDPGVASVEKALFGDSVQMGFRPVLSCVNYQTVQPPTFGEHLAWGDTGAAAAANGLFGARTNFEGGPSTLASGLLGFTPAYGFHLEENRYANLLVRLDCSPREIADWGAIAVWTSELARGYETVPVFHGEFAPPDFDMLKQLGVALASHGGHAMFHVVGSTPEAPSLEQALGPNTDVEEHVMSAADLEAVFSSTQLPTEQVDLVVFAAPQLGFGELRAIVDRLEGRRVHKSTTMIVAVDPQIRAQADREGLTERLIGIGGQLTTGTCFYPEAPLLRAPNHWHTVVTNSAKLVNTLQSAGYACALRRIDACLKAAASGKLAR